MGYPEDSRLKANGEEDCGRQQYVLGRLYVQKYRSFMLTLYVQQHDVQSAVWADQVIYGVPGR